jgi:hypothetical protein
MGARGIGGEEIGAIDGTAPAVKFLIDECLPTSLVAIADEHGHEGFHVVYPGMQGFKDHEVVKRAAERDYPGHQQCG